MHTSEMIQMLLCRGVVVRRRITTPLAQGIVFQTGINKIRYRPYSSIHNGLSAKARQISTGTTVDK